jgi:hypothetical protein
MPSRPGRKRKMGERHPKGQLKRDLRPYYSPSLHPHRQSFEWQGGSVHPSVFSELGRLSVTGALSPEQELAASLIVMIYSAHDCATGFRRAKCSPAYKLFYDRAKESQASNPQAKQNAISEFERLQEYMAALPKRTKTAVEELCLQDKFVGPADARAIREFLGEIALVCNFIAENKPKKTQKRSPPTLASSSDTPATGFVTLAPADLVRKTAAENEPQRRDFASGISRIEMRSAGRKSSRRH